MRELLEKYLMGQYIQPMSWDNCLTSKENLVLLLYCTYIFNHNSERIIAIKIKKNSSLAAIYSLL